MSNVAFVGLGAMGMPMARNLIAAGHAVTGFDLRPEPMAALVEAGGSSATSAADAAAEADVLMLMVVNAGQARAVLFDGGALAALPEGGVVLLTATCPPAEVAAIAAEVEAAGRRFVDAPVSGGTAGARAGSLSLMVACSDALFSELNPVLGSIGGKLFHVGQIAGQGAAVKVVNQLLCGVHIAAAAEALALAKQVGVDPAMAMEILGGSAAASWMLNDRGPRMLEADPEVTSAIDIFVKDLGLVLEAGRSAKAALPLAATAHQFFLSTSGRGDGLADDSQVIRSYHLLNGS
jgi:3-hydroxyisobutyrate dehydrogenase